MSTSNIARARIQIIVEVPASSWGGDCNLDQVYKQSTESALGAVTKVCQENKWKLVGVLKVEAIIIEENR